MHDRHDEARDDRRGQNAVRDSNIKECHHWHPDDIEDGNSDTDAFGTEPVQPANSKLALLLACEATPAWEEVAPMLLENLESLAPLPPRRESPHTRAEARVCSWLAELA